MRDGDIVGVWSPNRERAEATAAFGRTLDIGPCRTYRSVAAMVADPEVDAIWLMGPNQARIENVEEIVDTLRGARDSSPPSRARSLSHATSPRRRSSWSSSDPLG